MLEMLRGINDADEAAIEMLVHISISKLGNLLSKPEQAIQHPVRSSTLDAQNMQSAINL